MAGDTESRQSEAAAEQNANPTRIPEEARRRVKAKALGTGPEVSIITMSATGTLFRFPDGTELEMAPVSLGKWGEAKRISDEARDFLMSTATEGCTTWGAMAEHVIRFLEMAFSRKHPNLREEKGDDWFLEQIDQPAALTMFIEFNRVNTSPMPREAGGGNGAEPEP